MLQDGRAMSFDDIVTTGLVGLFGGTLVWAAVGTLVGRFQGFQVGVATGMILFGLTGLGFAGWLAWLLWGPGAEVAPGLTEAELHYLRREEWACEPDDVLWRRSKLGLHYTPAERQQVAGWMAANPVDWREAA